MGDEVNAFDLPQSHQSGSVDIGHLSENVQSEESRLIGLAGENLNHRFNDYYQGNIDGNELYDLLVQDGYSEDRAGDFLDSANTERSYRETHNQEPSNLSPNQLLYLRSVSRQHANFNFSDVHLRQNEQGRIVFDDFTRRDLDGGPIQITLPEARRYDPLDDQTRAELNIDEGYLQYITVQDPVPDDEHLYQDTLDQRTINQVSQITSQYLDRIDTPEGDDQRRLEMYQRIQALPGIQNQRNVRAKLVDLFRSISEETQYRLQNNGRPRGLTDSQWDVLQRNNFYYGQPILETNTDPPIKYIVSGTQIIQIDDNIEEVADRQRRISVNDEERFNVLITNFLNDRNITEDQLKRQLREQVRLDLTDDSDLSLRFDIDDRVERANEERIFRSQNDGRPQGISELQYEFLLNHTLAEGEQRYQGEPLQRRTIGGVEYSGYIVGGDNQQLLVIPTDELINQMIQQGTYRRPQRRPDLPPLPPTPEDPDFRDSRIITAIGQDNFDNLNEQQLSTLRGVVDEKGDLLQSYNTLQNPDNNIPPRRPRRPGHQITEHQELIERPVRRPPRREPPSARGLGEPREPVAPGIIPEAPPGFDPPIVPGQQTQPINLRTGEDLPVDSPERNIIRYQQFYNDNQNLYLGFRDVFSNILPVLSAGAGAYMGYLYRASKEKSTIQTIIYQEQELLNNLEGRVQGNLQELEREVNLFQRRQDIAERTGRDIERFLTADIRNRDLLVRNKMDDLRRISRIIERQKSTIERLQKDITDTQIYTRQTDIDIRNLQNTNYELFNNLYNYSPQILTGLSVGYTLGLMLSGYLFPTYMNINEPYITAENIEYTDNNELFKKIKKDAETMKHLNKNNEDEISPVIKREYDPPPSKIIKPYKESFKPQKHGKRPLKYNEIQELKATLKPDELQKLKGKYLYFDDGKLNAVKSQDKCDNIIQEVQIRKRKVFK